MDNSITMRYKNSVSDHVHGGPGPNVTGSTPVLKSRELNYRFSFPSISSFAFRQSTCFFFDRGGGGVGGAQSLFIRYHHLKLGCDRLCGGWTVKYTNISPMRCPQSSSWRVKKKMSADWPTARRSTHKGSLCPRADGSAGLQVSFRYMDDVQAKKPKWECWSEILTRISKMNLSWESEFSACGLSDDYDTMGRYHGGRRPSIDDSFHTPAVIPPSTLDKQSIVGERAVTPYLVVRRRW